MKLKKVEVRNLNPSYWERILAATGFGLNRGSLRDDPEQKNAVKKYLRDNAVAISEQEAREARLDIISD